MSASAGRIMMIPKGDYDATVTYRILDIVSYNGSSYVAKRTTVGNVPTDTNYWQPVADMSAKMDRSVYDSNNNGIVDNAEKVNNHTVEKDVPADAKFTDTKTLSGMTDTDINNPTEGQTLRYNATTRKFENGTVASTFNSLSDTNFVDLRDGQVPMYDSETSKWINADVEGLIPIVTWADGTDDQIATMLDAHYQGIIDVRDYWTVGDERVVHLSAMEATGVRESHVAQDVTLVLMNEGGKTLTTPINNITECAFIVGQKDLLQDGTTFEGGNMNSSGATSGGWDASLRRTWCNNVYRAAIPESLRGIFKLHQNVTSNGSSGSTTSSDYFALPAEKEVFGNNTVADGTAESSLSQFEYYENQSARMKYPNDPDYPTPNLGGSWRLRSPSTAHTNCFAYVTPRGEVTGGSSVASSDALSIYMGISPYGVI